VSNSLERWNLDFVVSKSIRYHAYRRSFWDTFDNVSNILTVMSGTAVLVTLVGQYQMASTILAIVVALTSAANLVLGFSQKARNHDGLYRAFSRLAQDIAENEKPSSTMISAWRRRRLEIEMDEPFIVDLLERRCSAEEARARGCELRPAWKLTTCETIIAQFAFWPGSHRDETPEAS
jgi:hypothetical protein